MEKQKRIPRRRFREFLEAGEWEQKKLDEIAPIIMGQSPDGSSYTNNPSDNILVQGNADMRERKVFPRVWTKQVTKTGLKGDIIISVRAPVGDVGKTNYNVVLGRGVAAIRGNEFLYQSLIKLEFDRYWSNVSTGTTFDSIDSKTLSVVKIALPLTEEQSKIGDFCRRLDMLISLHQQKLAKLKDLKQAYLTEMFPAPGEKRPRRRFKGFSGDWEEVEIGNIGLITTGSTPSTDIPSFYGNEFLLVSPVDIQGNRYVTDTATKLSAKGLSVSRVIRAGASLFVCIGSTIGKVGQIKIRAATNQQINSLEAYPAYNDDFVFALLERNSGIVKNISATQAVPIVNKNTFSHIKVLVPVLKKEQQVIGQYFKSIDVKLDLQQQYLNKLQSLKQAYLSELFV